MSLERESPESDQHPQRVPKRFPVVPYREDYAPGWSVTFENRCHDLFTFIHAYMRHRQPSRWAKCCKTFEGRVPRGSLGHPEYEMVHTSHLVKVLGIRKVEDLQKYVKKQVSRNKDGDLQLPQANMAHPFVKKEEEDLPEEHKLPPAPPKDEESQAKIEALESQLNELKTKEESQSQEISDLKSQIVVPLYDLGAQVLNPEAY